MPNIAFGLSPIYAPALCVRSEGSDDTKTFIEGIKRVAKSLLWLSLGAHCINQNQAEYK